MNRLTSCADVIRLVVKIGAPKLKIKTIKAVVEHIIQILPQADGDFFEPLSQDYLKSLCAVLEHKLNVELLSRSTWHDAVRFCLQYINKYSDENDGDTSSLFHNSSGHDTSNFTGSAPRSGFGRAYTQIRTGTVSRQNADDLLLALFYLVSAPNAPLLEADHVVVSSIIRFLSLNGSSVSSSHKSAFSALNVVLLSCREDRCVLLQSVAQEVIPIISRFWQGKALARDEMLNSVRDEMIILLLIVHLYLERSVMDGESADLLSNLSYLSDVMRTEYTKRSDRDRLHLDDLDMADPWATSFSLTPFCLHSFRLRPHDIKAERHWANLQVIAIIEGLVTLGETNRTPIEHAKDENADKHPRKRQRTAQPWDRLIDPIRSEDENVRLVGLQILPFVLETEDCHLSAPVLIELLSQLIICSSDKRGHIASWALLTIAR